MVAHSRSHCHSATVPRLEYNCEFFKGQDVTREFLPGPAGTTFCSKKDVVLGRCRIWEIWADHLKTPQNGVKWNSVLLKSRRRMEGFARKMVCDM